MGHRSSNPGEITQAQDPARSASDHRLDYLLKTIEGIVWEATTDPFAYTYVSPRVEEMLGVTVDRWLAEPDVRSSLMHPDDRGEAAAALARVVEHGEEQNLEYRVRTPDGRVLWVSDTVAPMPDADGRVSGVRGVVVHRTGEHALRENQERLSFLARASTLLAGTLDLQSGHDTLARVAVQHLGDWALVDVVERDGSLVRAAGAHADPDHADLVSRLAKYYPSDDLAPPTVARTGRHELYTSPQRLAADETELAVVEKLGVASALSAPIVARGRILAVLTLVSADSTRPLSPSEVGLVQDLALRAGLALDNARLYQERSRVARTLQASLLPPESPSIPTLDVAARFHPAGEGTEIGGDFYDVFQTGPSTWAAMVGDVVGKGTDAAATTALARHTLRTSAMHRGKPSEILRTLNGALLRQDTPDKYCTAVFAQIEPLGSGARIVLSCGGHPAPFLVRAAGEVERVECNGTLLGLLDDIFLMDVRVELGPGDAVLLFTDGVTEGRGTSVFGEDALHSKLKQWSHSSAGELAERLEAEVLEHQGGRADDDIAILVVRAPVG